MEMQIAAAADHGVNVFIYDWYWYDGRLFLEQCLNNGYLKARNNDRRVVSNRVDGRGKVAVM